MSSNDNKGEDDLDKLIDASNVPHSVWTSWAMDKEGDFVLVLEDEKHEPIALCVYKWADWLETYRTLLDLHDQHERKKGQ